MNSSRPMVLLAEDEEHIAKLVAFKLGREGFEVVTAKNGLEALQLFASREWSAVILDVMMPAKNGWETLKEIRACGSKVPVLMLTAKGDPQALANAAQLGATDFLKKPFDPAELAKKLREIALDPELEALKKEFVASFDGRAIALEKAIGELEGGGEHAYAAIQEIAHKLGGAAENYGFPALSVLGGALDDYLLARVPPVQDEVIRFARLYLRAIREAESGEDPVGAAAEPLALELISVSESRASGASSGSS